MNGLKPLYIIGAGGHGRVCAEIAEAAGYDRIVFLDGNRKLRSCGKYEVAGPDTDFYRFINENTQFFVAIGDAAARKHMQEQLVKAGGTVATLVHPDAVVSGGTGIGAGTVIMAGTVVNPGTVIGRGVIVNTCSSADHDCRIGDFSHIAVGAHLCGTVSLGENGWVGAGAIVSNGVNICPGCTIGAGAVVVRDIRVPGTYIGIPARRKE